MSVRIGITGLRRERVAVVPSPLAELGMALHVLSEPGHHPGLRGWATGVTARLDAHLADRLSEADFLWRTSFSDLFMPFAGIPGRDTLPGATLADDLDLLDKLTDDQFVDAGLEFVCTPVTRTTRSGPVRCPTRRCGGAPWSLPPRAGRSNCGSPGGCWRIRPVCGPGCGSSWRTATRPSSPRPGPGCATRSRRTPATRRSCCATGGWPRRWPPCRPR